ncbi:MAG: hypothetical protein NTX50_32345 [Candidatus Sumerlaeota bacterium]|nr:hypothetical protein [Candidatus Sumerlaeota bacterium]
MNRNLIIVVFAGLALLVVLVVVSIKPPIGPGPDIPPGNITTETAQNSTPPKPGGKRPYRTPLPPTAQGPADLNAGGKNVVGPATVVKVRKYAGEDALRAAIFGSDPVKREEALQQMAGDLQTGEGLNVLKELFISDDKELQQEALALIPNADEKYRMPLIQIGLDNTDPEFRLDTLNLLRDIAEVDVDPALIKAMADKDEEVLEEVSSLFFYFIDKPIYEAVGIGLKSENEQVREEALRYLEDVHTVKSVEMQMDLLATGDKEFGQRIGDSLRFITNADIDSNDPNEWRTWWKANRDEWAKDYETEMEGWGTGDGT